MSKISIDKPQLKTMSSQTMTVARTVATQLRNLADVADAPGLPSNISGDVKRVLNDVTRLEAELTTVAAALRGRLILADLCDRGLVSPFRLAALEHHPERVVALSIDLFNLGQSLRRDLLINNVATSSFKAGGMTLGVLAHYIGPAVLTQAEINAIGATVGASVGDDVFKVFTQITNDMLRSATSLGSASSVAIANILKSSAGQASIGGVLAVGWQLWDDRNRDDLTDADRFARVGVSAGAGFLAAGAAAVACVGSSGLLCPLSVGFVAGLVTTAAATGINETYFSGNAREFRRWQEQMNRLTNIYMDTGVLSRGDLEDSKRVLRYQRVGSAGSHGYAKEAWLRPDGSVAIERTRTSSTWGPEKYFTPDGKEYNPP